MCTAATYKTKDFYFGRTLDYEFSYGEEVTVTPRNYNHFFPAYGRNGDPIMPSLEWLMWQRDYPLYYDAVNEKGVGMAGLNFVGNAVYQEIDEAEDGKENVGTV